MTPKYKTSFHFQDVFHKADLTISPRKGPFNYYMRVFWGFFQPLTFLHKDIFST